MASKSKDAIDQSIPTPPIPPTLLPKGDTQAADPAVLKPEDFRARLQLAAVKALDGLEWHVANLGDSKASIEASREILNRAGYVPPAKPKPDEVPVGEPSNGIPLDPIEDDIRGLSEAFSEVNPTREGPSE